MQIISDFKKYFTNIRFRKRKKINCYKIQIIVLSYDNHRKKMDITFIGYNSTILFSSHRINENCNITIIGRGQYGNIVCSVEYP